MKGAVLVRRTLRRDNCRGVKRPRRGAVDIGFIEHGAHPHWAAAQRKAEYISWGFDLLEF
jgi:hypothetical protein